MAKRRTPGDPRLRQTLLKSTVPTNHCAGRYQKPLHKHEALQRSIRIPDCIRCYQRLRKSPDAWLCTKTPEFHNHLCVKRCKTIPGSNLKINSYRVTSRLRKTLPKPLVRSTSTWIIAMTSGHGLGRKVERLAFQLLLIQGCGTGSGAPHGSGSGSGNVHKSPWGFSYTANVIVKFRC